MKKLIAFVPAVLLLTNFTFAQPAPDDFPQPPKEKRIVELLKLSPDQEKKFNDITYQHRKDVIDIRAKIQKNRLELKKMIDENKIDEKIIIQLTDENSKLQGDIKYSAVKRWLDIYKMLNEEQKKIWTKHLSHMTDPQAIRERIKGGIKKFMMGNRGMRMHHNEF